ncbi:hypothetical protein [Micromonospora sp. HK10]|uniref:hypothetical protein n=1 Tax=Micromonospora sp. HK10 TaxID=1538294 RepID=UPI0006271D4C|nr:hypothetical protein [Micromonospora sp. HK10]KKK05779.1 hypothetical protein LQ51_11960 [Micromonospora sp. HK10]
MLELGTATLRQPPKGIVLTVVPYDLRRTVVSVRINPSSPYRVENGRLRLFLADRPIAEVGLLPMPDCYRHTLANGKSVMAVARTRIEVSWRHTPSNADAGAGRSRPAGWRA